MLFLVAALLLMGAVIAVWLGIFALRELHGHDRGTSAH